MVGVQNKAHMTRQTINAARHQRGVAAIEFLLIMMFMLPAFYVATALAISFVAQQSVTQAAAEGARAALRAGSLSDRQGFAKAAAANSTQWPSITLDDVTATVETNGDGTSSCGSECTLLRVSVSVPQTMVAIWPGLGNLIPTQWTSSSVATLDNSTLTPVSGDGSSS